MNESYNLDLLPKPREELFDGRVQFQILPRPRHGVLMLEFYNILRSKIPAPFKVFTDCIKIEKNDSTIVQPDLSIIGDFTRFNRAGNYAGAPPLVAEIWAPGNRRDERREKLALYESMGVAEFWSIDYNTGGFVQYYFKDGKYVIGKDIIVYNQQEYSSLSELDLCLEDYDTLVRLKSFPNVEINLLDCFVPMQNFIF
ncbi:MAG: hypothetical protein ATN34_02640 [Epulopiscium sp. Nele67-Bin002]|nr:MAG: hypothetical protein BEN18_04565 [Epulopiscium sp. Nuni2H_MBin001]OON91727.1 MAG: hypothetical protein ATN33_08745 [Epulopiscium sp. Nele67-Bin001]OON92279.1 MAG: hypothetical protein ATN34_02640 [Epulopiscium sp. Nele67-Bin002]